MDAVDHKRLEVPPHRGSLQDGEVNGGESLHGLAPIVGHVEHEVIVDHIETVAARNAWPHVEIVFDKQRFGGCCMVLATEGGHPGKERVRVTSSLWRRGQVVWARVSAGCTQAKRAADKNSVKKERGVLTSMPPS